MVKLASKLCSYEKEERGFSLVELLVAMAISGIILGSLYSVFIIQNKTLKIQEQITEMVENVRAAVDLISREIRMAGYNPTGASFTGLTYHAGEIQIRADLNGNGTLGDENEQITYAYDSVYYRINRNNGNGNQAFAENIQEFLFTYLDSNGQVTTSTNQIRQMIITVTGRTAKPDPRYSSNNGYRTYTLRTKVIPKNLAN